MSKSRALPVVLEVLDDGLRLYRRHLAGFTLVATAVLVLIALFSLSLMAFVRSEIGTSAGWSFLAFMVLLVIGYPLLLYAFAALSRATAAALDGQAITLWTALKLSPLRGLGMIFFNLLFSFVASMGASVVMMVVSCPIIYLSTALTAIVASVGGGSSFSSGLTFFGVIAQVSVLWTLSVTGAWLASCVFALQAFVLEQQSWTHAVSRSIDVLTTRFGRSMLMFLAAGAIFSTLMVAYLGSLLTLSFLIQDLLSLNLSPLASDVITIVLTVASLVILLPPLSIWMTMFYRRQTRDRDGEEIARRVADWRAAALSGS